MNQQRAIDAVHHFYAAEAGVFWHYRGYPTSQDRLSHGRCVVDRLGSVHFQASAQG